MKGIAVLVVLGATLWFLTPAHLEPLSAEPVLPDDLDAWLQHSEKQATEQYGLVPDTEKRISWFGEREQTAY